MDISELMDLLKESNQHAPEMQKKFPAQWRAAKRMGLLDLYRGPYNTKRVRLMPPGEKPTPTSTQRYTALREHLATLDTSTLPVAPVTVWQHFVDHPDKLQFDRMEIVHMMVQMASRGELVDLKTGKVELRQYRKSDLFDPKRKAGGNMVPSYRKLLDLLRQEPYPLTTLTRRFGKAKIDAAEQEGLILRHDKHSFTAIEITDKGRNFKDEAAEHQRLRRDARRENILKAIPETPVFTARAVRDRTSPLLPLWEVSTELMRLVKLDILSIAVVRMGIRAVQYQLNPNYP